MTTELNPNIEAFRPLLGTWRGRGTGEYPTIEPFAYLEEVTFGHVGKPFLAYAQKTRDASTDLPLHAETGYWRLVDGRSVEVVLAHPTGLLEMLVGSIEGSTIDLRSQTVAGTPTAKDVTEVTRIFEIDGDRMRYRVAMAAVGQPLTHHLEAELSRVTDS